MITELLDIQPRELEFTFELKKQCSCCVRLVNKTDQHVAFKIKTTSPKKYCVRPNTGVIKPKSKCDFTVTMQAQRSAPPDMICKDKFLIQSTIVPEGTIDEDITASTFLKDGKYVEESKLKVFFVSPPHSPILSPIKGTQKQVSADEASAMKNHILNGVEVHDTYDMMPAYEASVLKDDIFSGIEPTVQYNMVTGDVKNSKMENTEEFKLAKGVELKTRRDVGEFFTEDVKNSKMENTEEFKLAKGVELKARRDVEELQLVEEIEEMKSKLNGLELKLSEAQVTISKLVEERRLTAKEGESLRKELALLRNKKDPDSVQVGFPLLFVVMVALISIIFGYLLH